ncbi:hypothetical protein JCM11641_004229 [Rhodosporidiobolus odoratus]
MTTKRTPTRFANDRTNLPSSSSSSSTTSTTRIKSTPSFWRQTSLADAFRRPSPPASNAPSTPAASTSASSALFTPVAGASSRLGTSPSRVSEAEDVDVGDESLFDGDMDALERDGSRKRRRVQFEDEVDEEDEPMALFYPLKGDAKGKAKMRDTYNVPGRQMSAFEAFERRELGGRAGPAQLSMRAHLRTIVSSNEEDVTRIPSLRSNRNFAPPFALAFANASKAGGKKVAAVADEEGMVSFLRADTERWTRGPTRHSFQAHDNAVFDLSWSEDDHFLATASGDQTVRLWDVSTQSCVGVLTGHTCTIKNVTWDPSHPHMLSTASRDGSIRVWDRRVQAKYGCGSEEGELGVATVNQIKNAHGMKGKGAKGRSATRSVTGVAYLKHQPNLLASSGSSDSTVKIWDLRRSHSRRVNPQSYETNEDAASSLCTSSSSARPHGIASMSLAPDGRRIYALSTDSQIYAFNPLDLTLPAPVSTYSSLQARFSSFYVRCAVSPCSRYLASGSSDGGVLLWDVEGNGKDAVQVVGHEKEVSGIDWASGDSLATCSDDLLVRYWRPGHRISQLRQRATAEDDHDSLRAKERWSGEVLEA